MRLWVRIAAVMAVVSIAPLVISSLRAVEIATDQAERSSQEALRADAEVLATMVDTWVGDQVQHIAGWMQLFRLADQSGAQQEALQRSIFLAVPTVVTLTLVDGDGVSVVPPLFLEADTPVGATLAGREAGTPRRASELVERVPLTEALAGRRPLANGVVGGVYRPPGSGSPSLPVGATGPFGEDLVLGAEVTLAFLEELFEQKRRPDRAVALVSATGEDIFGGDHPLVDTELLAPLLRTRSDVSYTLPDGRAVKGAVSWIERVDWAVVVVQPEEVYRRAGVAIRKRLLVGVVGAIVLALLAAGVLGRTLTEPVDRLRDVALAVSEGDFGRRVALPRRDEIGDLGRAFDRMSERLDENRTALDQQRSEIEAFNRELQQRVDERTRDLQEAQRQLVRSGQLAAVAHVGAGLAHELNNPLAAILGLTQILRERNKGGPAEASLQRIEEQAARCREVVGAMLRLTSGEVDPKEAPVVDLMGILRDVTGLVGGPLRQRGVGLRLQDPDTVIRTRVQPVFGGRVLAQILGALGAGLPEGAIIEVTAERKDGFSRVRFRPDQPLAQGTAKDDWMASGVGLWVARHMLDQAGGRLEEPTEDDDSWCVDFPGAE